MSDIAEEQWLQWIRHRVLEEVANGEHSTFASLLHGLPGLSPEATLNALHWLVADGALEADAHMLISSASEPAAEAMSDPIDIILPPPHPLDHEWRFSLDTRQWLSDLTSSIAGPRGHVLALGCPTVAVHLIESKYQGKITLIDNNPSLPTLSVTDHYQQITGDLRNGEATSVDLASVVIADPPFYPEHIQAFLRAASKYAHHGATVLFSLPPAATRPSARQDVEDAVLWASDVGLTHIEVVLGKLRYNRPPFERNAHRARGLLGVPDDWRVADLHVFTRSDQPHRHRLDECEIIDHWTEVDLGTARWRIRVAGPDSGQMLAGHELLQEVVPGNVLDSVSGRDPRRALANVWTDGNLVWRTQYPHLLLVILQALADGSDPLRAAQAASDTTSINPSPADLAAAVDQVQRMVSNR